MSNFNVGVPDLSVFMNYEYDVDLHDDSAAAYVIEMAGTHKRVLEVGAGSGSITKHLILTSKCDVVALEINPASVAKLRKLTSAVYSLDLNDADWPKQLSSEDKFDVVIAADVLEHLYDPWTVLKGMTSLLREDGSIILSLPHAGHSSVLNCLFDEDVAYGEWGLLDKTHIRFFGIHNIQALYESAGFAISDARFVMCSPKRTEFADRWRRLRPDVKWALSRNKFGNVYQVVTKAARADIVTSPVILADCPVKELPRSNPLTKLARSLRRRFSGPGT